MQLEQQVHMCMAHVLHLLFLDGPLVLLSFC